MKSLLALILLVISILWASTSAFAGDDSLKTYNDECMQQVNYFKDTKFDPDYLPRCIQNKVDAERAKENLKVVRETASETLTPELGVAAAAIGDF